MNKYNDNWVMNNIDERLHSIEYGCSYMPEHWYKADEVDARIQELEKEMFKLIVRIMEYGLCHKLTCASRKSVHAFKCDCGLKSFWNQLDDRLWRARKATTEALKPRGL